MSILNRVPGPLRTLASNRQLVTLSPHLQAGKSIVSAVQYNREEIEDVLQMSTYMHRERSAENAQKIGTMLSGRVLGSMYFQDSTVTRPSFHAAMQRLGGTVLDFDHEAWENKPIEDSVRTMSQIVDCILFRHEDVDVSKVAPLSNVPLINSSSLNGDHPTQALLDLFTIVNELGIDSPDNLNITMVGNLSGERVVHGLVSALSQFDGVSFNFVAPDQFQVPSEVTSVTSDHKLLDSFDEVIATTDVMYFTEVNPNSFDSVAEYDAYIAKYKLELSHMEKANPDLIVMHPLPRTDEISVEVDNDPRAVYFRQAGYGLSTRMALLTLTCGTDTQIKEAKGYAKEAARVVDRQPLRKRRPLEGLPVANTDKWSSVEGTSKSGRRKSLSARPMQGKVAHSL